MFLCVTVLVALVCSHELAYVGCRLGWRMSLHAFPVYAGLHMASIRSCAGESEADMSASIALRQLSSPPVLDTSHDVPELACATATPRDVEIKKIVLQRCML